MHTKICAQQQSKITREMIGCSRDGNGWNLEYVIKPSQSQQCPPPKLLPLMWSCPAPPHGIWGAEGQKGWGATAVECTRDTRRDGGLVDQAGKEEMLGWGYPHNSVSSTSPSFVTQK